MPCVAVLLSRRMVLPTNSAVLGTTPSLCYAIPAELVDEAGQMEELTAVVESERAAVHAHLVALLTSAVPALRALDHGIARTDAAVARARHAAWCSGVPVTLYQPFS